MSEVIEQAERDEAFEDMIAEEFDGMSNDKLALEIQRLHAARQSQTVTRSTFVALAVALETYAQRVRETIEITDSM